MAYFQESCSKLFLEDITRNEMLRFAAYLRNEAELAPRTCWNKFNNTMTFLKDNDIRAIVKAADWPKFVEEEPEVYEQEDLAKLHSVSGAEERLWWNFFLMTGFREQEVMYCFWRNVNFNNGSIAVQWNLSSIGSRRCTRSAPCRFQNPSWSDSRWRRPSLVVLWCSPRLGLCRSSTSWIASSPARSAPSYLSRTATCISSAQRSRLGTCGT